MNPEYVNRLSPVDRAYFDDGREARRQGKKRHERPYVATTDPDPWDYGWASQDGSIDGSICIREDLLNGE